MLALMGVANDGAEATLVFDEVDAGIGGHTARAVGSQLRALADGRQILCITHLPQIASLAARHFSIEKDSEAEPARTTVRELGSGEVVAELVRMLGADADDVGARRHARGAAGGRVVSGGRRGRSGGSSCSCRSIAAWTSSGSASGGPIRETPTGSPERAPRPAGSATTGKPVKFQVEVRTISGSPSPPRLPES